MQQRCLVPIWLDSEQLDWGKFVSAVTLNVWFLIFSDFFFVCAFFFFSWSDLSYLTRKTNELFCWFFFLPYFLTCLCKSFMQMKKSYTACQRPQRVCVLDISKGLACWAFGILEQSMFACTEFYGILVTTETGREMFCVMSAWRKWNIFIFFAFTSLAFFSLLFCSSMLPFLLLVLIWRPDKHWNIFAYFKW